MNTQRDIGGVGSRVFFIAGRVFLSLDVPDIGLVEVRFGENPVGVFLVRANDGGVAGVQDNLLNGQIKVAFRLRGEENLVEFVVELGALLGNF